MAEDTINKAIELSGLEPRKCVTKSFRIHGYCPNPDLTNHLYIYGSDEPAILQLQKENPSFAEKLSSKFDYTVAEVIWAVREEMARTVDDVLARRVRMLYIDSKEAVNVAPKVAAIIAKELGYDKTWEEQQIKDFTTIASNYIVNP